MHVFSIKTVPRKVLRESFDSPLELDEHDHNAPAIESEFDEDDHIYKESEAIPPAPKLQGAIPRTNSSHSMTVENSVPFDPISTPNKNDQIAEGQSVPRPTEFNGVFQLLTLLSIFFLFSFVQIITRNCSTFVYYLV